MLKCNLEADSTVPHVVEDSTEALLHMVPTTLACTIRTMHLMAKPSCLKDMSAMVATISFHLRVHQEDILQQPMEVLLDMELTEAPQPYRQ